MKKFLLFFIVSLIIFSTIYFIPKKSDPYADCVSFGVCQAGLTVNIDGKLVTISEEYCNNNKYRWKEKNKICYIGGTIQNQNDNFKHKNK